MTQVSWCFGSNLGVNVEDPLSLPNLLGKSEFSLEEDWRRYHLRGIGPGWCWEV